MTLVSYKKYILKNNILPTFRSLGWKTKTRIAKEVGTSRQHISKIIESSGCSLRLGLYILHLAQEIDPNIDVWDIFQLVKKVTINNKHRSKGKKYRVKGGIMGWKLKKKH